VSNTLHIGYERALRDFRVAFSQGGALTCIVLILLGVGLDHSLYPDKQFEFAVARIGFSLVIFGIILAMRTRWGADHIPWLTFAWLLQPQFMIVWMIATTEGATSIYYAGLTLAMYASGIVLAFGLWQNLVFGCISILLYAGACSVHPDTFVPEGPFAVNTLLLVMAAVTSAVYTYFNERARFMLYRLRAEVSEKNAQLEKTNKDLAEIKGQMLQQEKMAAIGTLSSGLLHEVNNPVNYCLMAINLAIEHPTAKSDATMHEYLADAREGMQRIQRIVSDLKTFAYRPRDADSTGSDFPLSRALDTALRMVGHETRDIAITRELPDDSMVHGDEGAIVGVLINLLSNAASAVRSIQQQAPEISVSAIWSGDRLRVTVADNGPGISPENLARVFEPFFTTREIGQGLGLGLSISYSVIERHGGTLLAESEAGAGTRMIFDLPRAGQ
jgi:two-component system sensor histidine kinase PhcS